MEITTEQAGDEITYIYSRGCAHGLAAQGEAWSKATHPPPPNPATPITSPECAAASRVGLERGWACIGLELEYSNTTKNKPEIARKRRRMECRCAHVMLFTLRTLPS